MVLAQLSVVEHRSDAVRAALAAASCRRSRRGSVWLRHRLVDGLAGLGGSVASPRWLPLLAGEGGGVPRCAWQDSGRVFFRACGALIQIGG
jgi:hypothetical protein